MVRAALACLAASALTASAFVPPVPAARPSQTKLAAKSKSVPFLEAPPALDGSMVGDIGFDPLSLTNLPIDFSYVIVPTEWAGERKGLSVVKYFRESEIKHCRLAMLAVLGWVAVDLGLRLPGDKYQGVNPLEAHDAFVKSGDMFVGLLALGALEVITGVAIWEMAKGSDRQPGEFGFDPLKLASDPSRAARYQLSELKNGRIAMIAFGGIVTQAVLTGHGFPYLN